MNDLKGLAEVWAARVGVEMPGSFGCWAELAPQWRWLGNIEDIRFDLHTEYDDVSVWGVAAPAFLRRSSAELASPKWTVRADIKLPRNIQILFALKDAWYHFAEWPSNFLDGGEVYWAPDKTITLFTDPAAAP